jgi:hypothetical protein
VRRPIPDETANMATTWLRNRLLTLAVVSTGCPSGANGDAPALGTARQPLTLISGEIIGRPSDNSVTVQALADGAVEAYFDYGTAPGN